MATKKIQVGNYEYVVTSHKMKGTPPAVRGSSDWSWTMIPCKWGEAEYISLKNSVGHVWLWIQPHSSDEFYYGKTPETTTKGPYASIEAAVAAAVR